jgi:hypothetical protein
VTKDQLSLRALNRVTLGRQLLLDGSALTPARAIAHLAGLQAQAPRAPYVGLQVRLASFRPEHLENLMTKRVVLRAHLMRNTVHLVDALDYLRFRPLYQPVMARALAGHWGRRLAGVDPAEVATVAADLLAETPLTRADLAHALAPPLAGPRSRRAGPRRQPPAPASPGPAPRPVEPDRPGRLHARLRLAKRPRPRQPARRTSRPRRRNWCCAR